MIHLSSPELGGKLCVFPEVDTTFLIFIYVTCRLAIVLDSNIRYEIVVIKQTLDIYMNTQAPLLKVCYNPTTEDVVITWYLFAMFRKDIKNYL